MTDEEAALLWESAPEVTLSPERIREIVEYATCSPEVRRRITIENALRAVLEHLKDQYPALVWGTGLYRAVERAKRLLAEPADPGRT